MLLSNPHVKDPCRKARGQNVQPCPRWHRSSYADNLAIARSLGGQGIAKDRGIGWGVRLGFRLRARDHIKLGHAVVFVRSVFRGGIALALDRHCMNEDRPRGAGLSRTQCGQQGRHVMTVNRPDIAKAQLFKQRATTRHPGDQRPRPTCALAQGAGQSGLEPFSHVAQRGKRGRS